MTASVTPSDEQLIRGYDAGEWARREADAEAAFAATVRDDWPSASQAFQAWLAVRAEHNRVRQTFNAAFQRVYGRSGPWGDYTVHPDTPSFSRCVDRILGGTDYTKWRPHGDQ